LFSLGSRRFLRDDFHMEPRAITIRQAKMEDASAVARVYIESWHDTYAAILPMGLLCAMTPRGQAARWQAAIRARKESVLVAEHLQHGIVGMTSFGASRDRSLNFDGEIYTLYVDPAMFGLGIGTALVRSAFRKMSAKEYESCVIWAHAKNNARFFYERLGGRLVAERMANMMGGPVPEIAFGWRALAVAEASGA
jgi:ribosomal protein S18 acetylase RimI-like enzyme